MAYTVRDIVMDADLFRQAYPDWPGVSPEPELEAPDLAARRARRRGAR